MLEQRRTKARTCCVGLGVWGVVRFQACLLPPRSVFFPWRTPFLRHKWVPDPAHGDKVQPALVDLSWSLRAAFHLQPLPSVAPACDVENRHDSSVQIRHG